MVFWDFGRDCCVYLKKLVPGTSTYMMDLFFDIFVVFIVFICRVCSVCLKKLLPARMMKWFFDILVEFVMFVAFVWKSWYQYVYDEMVFWYFGCVCCVYLSCLLRWFEKVGTGIWWIFFDILVTFVVFFLSCLFCLFDGCVVFISSVGRVALVGCGVFVGEVGWLVPLCWLPILR